MIGDGRGDVFRTLCSVLVAKKSALSVRVVSTEWSAGSVSSHTWNIYKTGPFSGL